MFCRRTLKLPAIFQFVGNLNRPLSSLTRQRQTHPTSAVTPIPLSIAVSKADVYSCNSKISHLGRHGKVYEASKLFDQMPRKDTVSYASMLTVYLKNNFLSQAEALFLSMPERSIVADSAMVSGYAKAGQIDKARQVFDGMVDRNAYSWTSLVSGYFRIGKIDEACRLFYQMPQKNIVSWTTLLSGFAQNGLIDKARDTFDRMPEKNIIAWTTMVKSYVENDLIDKALKLFYEMPHRNIYSWNIIISGCLNANRVNEAFRLFDSMPHKNAISWTTMIVGLARNGMTKLSRDYFDRMPEKDIAAWNAMITAYVDEGNMIEASELFNMMPEKNIVSWNAIVDGYTRIGIEGEALKHVILMLQCGFKPNAATFTSVLPSCESMMELIQVHAVTLPLGFTDDTPLTNALITMYSRCGDVSSARLVFDELEAKDVISWTAMVLAYSNHGYGHHALQVFARMLRSGSKPDQITFIGVLSACSHAGLVKKGEMLFDSMGRGYGLEPKAEHYSCLVDILGRAGQVDKAMSVVCEMPPDKLDGAVLGALLGACRLHGDVRLAGQIGEKLIELEPANSGSYVLLANVYAARGKWNEFALVRRKMKERKVKKAPGFSQIEINGKSHLFCVGDKSHPQVEEIYCFIEEKLLTLMKEMGYAENSCTL